MITYWASMYENKQIFKVGDFRVTPLLVMSMHMEVFVQDNHTLCCFNARNQWLLMQTQTMSGIDSLLTTLLLLNQYLGQIRHCVMSIAMPAYKRPDSFISGLA